MLTEATHPPVAGFCCLLICLSEQLLGLLSVLLSESASHLIRIAVMAYARWSGSSTCCGEFSTRFARRPCGLARGRELGRCGRRCQAGYRMQHAVSGVD